MMTTSHSSRADSESRQYDPRTQRLAIGAFAIALSAASIALIAASAPWQIRFPFVAAAALFGPAIPALRLRPELSLGQCLVYGMGADVALQMLVGLALVFWHVWAPVAVSLGLLVITLAVGLKLLAGGLRPGGAHHSGGARQQRKVASYYDEADQPMS
jgi:hypothetical protein